MNKNNLYNILKKYRLDDTYHQKLILFCNYNDIRLSHIYKLKQKITKQIGGGVAGGNTFITNIDKFTYTIKYLKSNENDKRIIIIDSDQIEGNCITLKYNKGSSILEIVAINSLLKCYSTNNELDIDAKSGSIMMKIIINFAKHYKFKSIILDDVSTYKCDTEKKNIYYNLSRVHTLCYGQPRQRKYR